ncbi:MAG: DinB family protein [Cyclobacteriaceae bacterium]
MPYTLHQHLSYSVWANTRLAETLQPVGEEILYAEVKSSFPSIAKTLLHLWDAEVIWMKRMQGISLTSWPSQNFSGKNDDLINGVVSSSKELLNFIELKGTDFLQSKISYKNMKGDLFEDVAENILYHIVNHGSYHRGQVTTLLHELGVTKIQSMDIIFYLRS